MFFQLQIQNYPPVNEFKSRLFFRQAEITKFA